MSAAMIIKGAELALDAIALLQRNKMNETDMFIELDKPEFRELDAPQKIRIVQLLTNNKIDEAQAAIDAI